MTKHYLPIDRSPTGNVQSYGNSGAIIKVDGNTVLKMAGKATQKKRILTQARWMQERGMSVCPKILSILDNAYVMERLNEVDWSVADPVLVMKSVKIILQDHVWNIPALTPQKWLAKFLTYVEKRAVTAKLPPEMIAAILDRVRQLNDIKGELEWCEIHGDPTLDNVMMRPHEYGDGCELVLTDALPYKEGKMPALKIVDLGKMLQSAWGYEQALGTKNMVPYDSVLQREMEMTILDGESPTTVQGAFIMALVHYVRLMPYQRGKKSRQAMFQILEREVLRVR